MKNKKILLLLFVIGLILLLILTFSNDNYTIKVELIDGFSPDRRLTVYQNNKKIEFEELQYDDGTYLCSGKNPIVSYSEIIGVIELIVKIDENKQIIAKIVEK